MWVNHELSLFFFWGGCLCSPIGAFTVNNPMKFGDGGGSPSNKVRPSYVCIICLFGRRTGLMTTGP